MEPTVRSVSQFEIQQEQRDFGGMGGVPMVFRDRRRGTPSSRRYRTVYALSLIIYATELVFFSNHSLQRVA